MKVLLSSFHLNGHTQGFLETHPVIKTLHFKTSILVCLQMSVKTLQLEDGRMIQAAKYGQAEEAAEAIELTDEERVMEAKLRVT